ncbi:MAG: toxin-antitoxin system protein [Candidatus Eremiobacterota bacterium]
MSTVRIGPQAHERLRRLAAEERATLQAVLERAIEKYEEFQFFRRLRDDFAALRSDAQAWEEYQEEVQAWDGTLMDGLDRGEQWGP